MRANFTASAAMAILVAWQALSVSCVAAERMSLPSMLQAGPYGDPILLVPNAASGPNLPLLRFEQGSSGRPAGASPPDARPVSAFGMGPGRAKTTGPRDLDDDDDDEDAPTRPGTLPTSFPKLPDPSPLAKRRSLGPHISPDLSYDATDRASLGVITNSARLDGRTTPSVTLPTASRLGTSTTGARASAAPVSSAKPRDVGLGLSFQYRFGQ